MCCCLQRQEEQVPDFSGHLVSPAQGHSWSSRGTLFSLTLWALSALWQGRAHGQVTPGLGWTVFAEFFMHPSHAARLRAPGWVRVQRTAPQDPHLPPGVTQWEPRSWGAGRPQASTRPHVPSRSEALLSRGPRRAAWPARFCLRACRLRVGRWRHKQASSLHVGDAMAHKTTIPGNLMGRGLSVYVNHSAVSES